MMDEQYVSSLAEVVKSFLNFSENCLRDGIINQEVYRDITINKKQFIKEVLKEQW